MRSGRSPKVRGDGIIPGGGTPDDPKTEEEEETQCFPEIKLSKSRSRRSSPGEVDILTRLSDWPMDWQSIWSMEGVRFIVALLLLSLAAAAASASATCGVGSCCGGSK